MARVPSTSERVLKNVHTTLRFPCDLRETRTEELAGYGPIVQDLDRDSGVAQVTTTVLNEEQAYLGCFLLPC